MRELVSSLMMASTMLSMFLLLVVPEANAAIAPGQIQSVLSKPSSQSRHQPWLLVSRGGSDADSDEEDEDDDEEGDESEEEEDIDIILEDEMEDDEEEEEDVVMVKSAVKATRKQKAKQTAQVKKTVSAKLSVKKAKKPSLIQRYVPYIVRTCLNPFMVIAMTKGYFASLFNLDYLAEDSSQDLRSALEEKAKKSGSSGGRKGKRTMKPGQAKTLSDLPQLNT